jgi:hypothetical protein
MSARHPRGSVHAVTQVTQRASRFSPMPIDQTFDRSIAATRERPVWVKNGHSLDRIGCRFTPSSATSATRTVF